MTQLDTLVPNCTVKPLCTDVTISYSVLHPSPLLLCMAIGWKGDPAVSVVLLRCPSKARIMSLAFEVDTLVTEGVDDPVLPFVLGRLDEGSNGVVGFAPVIPNACTSKLRL